MEPEADNSKPDHRRLGHELDLFTFSDLVGSGLPLFTPRGTILRDELLGFTEELQRKYGYQKVYIPHLTKEDLYKKSGHWDKFGEELFLVKSQETSDHLVVKPMNCPHHAQIYASRPRSYRELPIRYMESTQQYRDEKKGELNGLLRVRAITLDDAHVFCTLEQIEDEFTKIMKLIEEMYAVFGMEFKARLSFRDNSDAYLGDEKNWEIAQKTLEDVAKKLGLDYTVAEGDAAFYGPKIDIMVTDSLGRQWQCATEQLDFVQPERLELKYVDVDGRERTPVMIHKALLGSFERFLAVYLEHTDGKFPLWLAPEQLRIVTLNDDKGVIHKTWEVLDKAKEAGLRVELDNSNESVAKKIRDAEVIRIPYTVVIGPKEVESGQLSPRVRSDLPEISSIGVDELIEKLSQDAKTRK